MFLRSVTRLFHSTSNNASGSGVSREATPSISKSFAMLKEFMGVLKGNKSVATDKDSKQGSAAQMAHTLSTNAFRHKDRYDASNDIDPQSLLARYSKQGGVDEMIKYVMRECDIKNAKKDHEESRTREPNEAMTSLIAALCKSRNGSRALAMVDVAKSVGWVPTVQTYVTLLKYFGEIGDVAQCVALYQDMSQNGLPTRYVGDTLINVLTKHKKLAEAVQLLRLLREKGMYTSKRNYTTLSSQLCECGTVFEAQELFVSMAGDNYLNDEQACAPFITAFTMHGQMENVSAVMHMMVEQGMRITVMTYNAMLLGLFNGGRQTMVNHVFVEMQMKGVEADIDTYNTLLVGHSKAGNTHALLQTFHSLEAKFKPNVTSYNAMIELYTNKGKIATALTYLERAKQENTINGTTYHLVMCGYLSLGYDKEAMAIFESMDGCGVPRVIEMYNKLISHIANKGNNKLALALLDKMKREGFRPSPELAMEAGVKESYY